MKKSAYKKLITLVLGAVMAMGCLAGVTAATEVTEVNGGICGPYVTWSLCENGLLSLTGTGAMHQYKYGNSPWYAYRDDIKAVNIDEGITSIGEYAFYNCEEIEHVAFSGTQAQWESLPFGYGNDNLKRAMRHYETSFESTINCEGRGVYCPDCEMYITYTVNARGQHSFVNGVCAACGKDRGPASGSCGENATWELDDSGMLTVSGAGEIRDYLYGTAPWYDYAPQITDITVEDGITAIPSVFYGCSNAQSLRVPFMGPDVENPQPLGHFFGTEAYRGSVLVVQDYTDYYYPAALRTVTVGSGTIAYCGFRDCTFLTAVTLEEGVRKISYRAFENCDGLTQLSLPNSLEDADVTFGTHCRNAQWNEYNGVQYAGNSQNPYVMAISASDELTECSLHPDTRLIGCNAFRNCKLLTDITIPEGVSYIGRDAFVGCIALENAYFLGSLWDWCNIFHANNMPDEMNIGGENYSIGSNPCAYAENLYIDGKLLEGTLEIPEGITYIGTHFVNYDRITQVIFPESLHTVGKMAFNKCTGIQSVRYRGDKPKYTDYAPDLPPDGFDEEDMKVYWCFNGVVATAYYPKGNDTWAKRYQYGGTFTWVEYEPEYNMPGDLDGIEGVDNRDVEYLLWFTLFPEEYPLPRYADYNADEQLDNEDVQYLLWYTLFPDAYPLT